MNKLNINELITVSGGFWPTSKITNNLACLCSYIFCCKKARKHLSTDLNGSIESENFEAKEKRVRRHGIYAKNEEDYINLMDNSKDETIDTESLFNFDCDSINDDLSCKSGYKIHAGN